MRFRKILVANRGEIACRVMRTARALGYRSVAVHSMADVSAPHVGMADEAVAIGPASGSSSAAETYLHIERLLDAARRTGADAVHPGYGFLSERADFAEACLAAGLVFIGPPPDAIRAMGHKALAKRRMREAGVPCAPGYLGDDSSDKRLLAEAAAFGTPLLVKAVAGGGGRGMRLVRDLAGLPEALASARREATAAFGDGTLMLERLIERGRHIEVQVFADAHGKAVHLGERDCTAQRRRQKVIEEAPSPVVDAALRERMGADAVAAALAVGYRGAGTVEFIVDAEHRHYFLEMNTRLQVEHPVTECLTGIDLVEWQLRIAAGEPLPLRQDEVRFEGHAIEVRLYAEDPNQGFAPQTGRVLHWRPQAALGGRGIEHGRGGRVRIDAGILEGGVITPHYDPLVAKLIAHGRDRDDAIRRLTALIEDAPLIGPRHNGRFLRDLLNHPAFVEARMHTTLIDEWAEAGDPLLEEPAVPDEAWWLAAAVLARHGGSGRGPDRTHRPASVAAWDLTLAALLPQGPGPTRRVRIEPQGDLLHITHGDATAQVELQALSDHEVVARIDGIRRRVVCVVESDPAGDPDATRVHLALDGGVVSFAEQSPRPAQASVNDPRQARAPVAGAIAAVAVQVGDPVSMGQSLVCVEAMKMEMWLRAPADAVVRAVHVNVKDSVESGALLIELDLLPAGSTKET